MLTPGSTVSLTIGRAGPVPEALVLAGPGPAMRRLVALALALLAPPPAAAPVTTACLTADADTAQCTYHSVPFSIARPSSQAVTTAITSNLLQ